MQDRFHRFKVGDIACTVLSDGQFVYAPPLFPPPARFLFVNAPPSELAQTLRHDGVDPADWPEFVSAYSCLLIETGEERILVDTGAGGLGPDTGRLPASLAAAGLRPEDIDLVVLTHAHPDHLGGNADASGTPRFPAAQWVIAEREWDFWMNGQAERDLSGHGKEVLLRAAHASLDAVKDCIRLVAGEEVVAPGVRVFPTPGHTPGHMAVEVSSSGRTLLCVSDLFLHPAHLRAPGWFAVVDLLPETLVSSRLALLEKAADEDTVVMAFHFPFPGLGRVVRDGAGFSWQTSV